MSWFKKTNYLKSNHIMSGSLIVDEIFNVLGVPTPAPNGAYFTREHIEASMRDALFNHPSKSLQDEFVRKYDKTCAWWRWTDSVGDCDSRTSMFGSDMIQAALKEGWDRGIGFVDLWYASKSLRNKNSTKKWDGYHSAPAILHKDEKGKWKLRVYQPESAETEPSWNDSSDEVKFWVNAVGLV